ncbi:MAG: thermonuclease family protein [bacterium]|nr:thermonuclease family protein [bacterium]
MNKKILISIVFAAIILGLISYRSVPKRLQNKEPAQSAAVVNTASTIPQDTEIFYPVTKVVDGDTIVVNISGKNTTIRLIGLDTPETVDPQSSLRSRGYYGGVGQTSVQCFGKEASDKAKELLTGKRVRIEMDPSQGQLDKYGRTLAYVFLEDETNFNEMMIREGFGHEYTYNLPYKYQKQFKEAEQTARENKIGLWSPEACATASPKLTQ